jgi:hypothetical protein
MPRAEFELQAELNKLMRVLERSDLESEIAESDREFQDAPQQGAGCSGWERDRESFAKRAAEFYLRRSWKPGFRVVDIACYSPPPDWNCDAVVRDAKGGFVAQVNVQLSPADKLVRVHRNSDPETHMVCFYTYNCSADGQLVFKGSTCPAF